MFKRRKMNIPLNSVYILPGVPYPRPPFLILSVYPTVYPNHIYPSIPSMGISLHDFSFLLVPKPLTLLAPFPSSPLSHPQHYPHTPPPSPLISPSSPKSKVRLQHNKQTLTPRQLHLLSRLCILHQNLGLRPMLPPLDLGNPRPNHDRARRLDGL